MSSPLLLALETACGTPAVALLQGDAVRATAEAPAGSRGAEQLLPCIDEVLRAGGTSLDALDALAISIGPGSFTGLRVGVATAKGLAFGDALPVVPVPTLAALAHAAELRDRPVVAVVDAQRGELYAALFENGVETGTLGEAVHTREALRAALPEHAVVVGPAREAVVDGAPAPPTTPLVVSVGRLGVEGLARGEAVKASRLVPRYVRRAEAEVQRTGQRFE